jgi:DNA-binding FadR family transcriptional regulator
VRAREERRALPITAVEPRRLYRLIADQLRELIAGGEYPVGARLPAERELADALGVSRPSVREALIALEVEGRVRISVGSGVYVTEPGPAARVSAEHEGPFEVLSAREVVEAAVAAEAAAVPGDLAALDAALARAEACPGPNRSHVAHDRAFHVALAARTGNAVLARLVGELFDQRINPYFAKLARYFETPHTWRAAIEEHRAVRDAVAAGDPRAAGEAMRRHLRLSQERFSASFGEGGAAAPAAAERLATETSAARPAPRRARTRPRRGAPLTATTT